MIGASVSFEVAIMSQQVGSPALVYAGVAGGRDDVACRCAYFAAEDAGRGASLSRDVVPGDADCFVACAAGLLVNSLQSSPAESVVGLVLIASGLPPYFMTGKEFECR
jgi:hypothetical protein